MNLLVMDYESLFYHLFYNKHYLDFQSPTEHPERNNQKIYPTKTKSSILDMYHQNELSHRDNQYDHLDHRFLVHVLNKNEIRDLIVEKLIQTFNH
jgi:hypothetical protein